MVVIARSTRKTDSDRRLSKQNGTAFIRTHLAGGVSIESVTETS